MHNPQIISSTNLNATLILNESSDICDPINSDIYKSGSVECDYYIKYSYKKIQVQTLSYDILDSHIIWKKEKRNSINLVCMVSMLIMLLSMQILENRKNNTWESENWHFY